MAHRDLAHESQEIRKLFADIAKDHRIHPEAREIAMGRSLFWALSRWSRNPHPIVDHLPVVEDENLLTFEVR